MTQFRPDIAKAGGLIGAAHVYAVRIGGDDTDAVRPTFERPAWQAHAACRDADPEIFFPTRGQSTEPAKAICATCPVRDECLEWALVNGDTCGVWGGKSERQRKRMRIDRNLPTKKPGVCWQCGAEMTDTFHDVRRYCSDACRRAAHRARTHIA